MLMIDALPSEPSKDGAATARQLHTRLTAGAAAALLIVAGTFVWRMSVKSPAPPVTSQVTQATPPARNPVLDQLVETTKALEFSQQEAIDQLQVLQQLLAAQKAETKRSSDAVAALGDKLDALRQSFASIPAPSAEAAEAPQPAKSGPAAARARGKPHRIAASKAGIVAARH
jgi:septal ring factor EnvC (AmiA/AmiB activator)